MDTELSKPQWHVVYTRPKSERKVALSISDIGIEAYLPLHTVVRQWSDRRKKIEVPLFPGYVFVKLLDEQRSAIYSIDNMVSFVSFEKKPVVVREVDINAIRMVLSEDFEASPDDYFLEGQRIRIQHGQFTGLEGIIVKRSGNSRLLVRVDGLFKAFSFNISTKLAKIIKEAC